MRRHSKLVAVIYKFLSIVDRPLPSTIQQIHVSRLAKNCSIYNSGIFSEKFQSFGLILNYSLQIYFTISLENRCYIKILRITKSYWSSLRKHAGFPTILLCSIFYRKLRKQRLVVRRHLSGAPLTASRFPVSK